MVDTAVAALAGFLSAALMATISHFLLLRRVRHEKIEALRSAYFDRHLRAYQKFWTLLKPSSKYETEGSIIVVRNDRSCLSLAALDRFFQDFRDFFYSEDGLFLSRNLRTRVFDLRRHVGSFARDNRERIQDGLIELSRREKGRIQHGFHLIREAARQDIGLRDSRLPLKDLGFDDDEDMGP